MKFSDLHFGKITLMLLQSWGWQTSPRECHNEQRPYDPSSKGFAGGGAGHAGRVACLVCIKLNFITKSPIKFWWLHIAGVFVRRKAG